VRGQNFDRDGAVEPRVLGTVHLAHASGAERASRGYGPSRVPGGSIAGPLW
jgi:hypothetical protein